MNRSSFSLMVAASVALVLLGSPAPLHSQGANPTAPKTTFQTLIELKAANEALLQKQQQTLQKLDEIKAQADQLRIFTKRS